MGMEHEAESQNRVFSASDGSANDTGGVGETLRPAEALDSDEVRNDDGDVVVDPPDDWSEADTDEDEPLDQKLHAEEPDFGEHRGQVSGTPEDGESIFPTDK